MKYLKKFESEINIGTWQHFNGIQPVNQIVLEPKPLFSFLCNECGFEFATEEKDPDLGNLLKIDKNGFITNDSKFRSLAADLRQPTSLAETIVPTSAERLKDI